jgi:hypothetical protein
MRIRGRQGSGLECQSAPLSDLFLGRTDNIDIRFAAAIALLLNAGLHARDVARGRLVDSHLKRA